MKLNRDSRGEIAHFMGPGTEIHGELRFQDGVRLDGKFDGTVESSGTLVIGETGQIMAKIRIGRISISGRVEGTITASEKVEILHTGKVIGDISTPVLVVEEGAVLEGKCNMLKTESISSAKTSLGVAALEIKS